MTKYCLRAFACAKRYGGIIVFFFETSTGKVTRHKMRNVLLLWIAFVGSATGELVLRECRTLWGEREQALT